MAPRKEKRENFSGNLLLLFIPKVFHGHIIFFFLCFCFLHEHVFESGICSDIEKIRAALTRCGNNVPLAIRLLDETKVFFFLCFPEFGSAKFYLQ